MQANNVLAESPVLRQSVANFLKALSRCSLDNITKTSKKNQKQQCSSSAANVTTLKASPQRLTTSQVSTLSSNNLMLSATKKPLSRNNRALYSTISSNKQNYSVNKMQITPSATSQTDQLTSPTNPNTDKCIKRTSPSASNTSKDDLTVKTSDAKISTTVQNNNLKTSKTVDAAKAGTKNSDVKAGPNNSDLKIGSKNSNTKSPNKRARTVDNANDLLRSRANLSDDRPISEQNSFVSTTVAKKPSIKIKSRNNLTDDKQLSSNNSRVNFDKTSVIIHELNNTPPLNETKSLESRTNTKDSMAVSCYTRLYQTDTLPASSASHGGSSCSVNCADNWHTPSDYRTAGMASRSLSSMKSPLMTKSNNSDRLWPVTEDIKSFKNDSKDSSSKVEVSNVKLNVNFSGDNVCNNKLNNENSHNDVKLNQKNSKIIVSKTKLSSNVSRNKVSDDNYDIGDCSGNFSKVKLKFSSSKDNFSIVKFCSEISRSEKDDVKLNIEKSKSNVSKVELYPDTNKSKASKDRLNIDSSGTKLSQYSEIYREPIEYREIPCYITENLTSIIHIPIKQSEAGLSEISLLDATLAKVNTTQTKHGSPSLTASLQLPIIKSSESFLVHSEPIECREIPSNKTNKITSNIYLPIEQSNISLSEASSAEETAIPAHHDNVGIKSPLLPLSMQTNQFSANLVNYEPKELGSIPDHVTQELTSDVCLPILQSEVSLSQASFYHTNQIISPDYDSSLSIEEPQILSISKPTSEVFSTSHLQRTYFSQTSSAAVYPLQISPLVNYNMRENISKQELKLVETRKLQSLENKQNFSINPCDKLKYKNIDSINLAELRPLLNDNFEQTKTTEHLLYVDSTKKPSPTQSLLIVPSDISSRIPRDLKLTQSTMTYNEPAESQKRSTTSKTELHLKFKHSNCAIDIFPEATKAHHIANAREITPNIT